MKSSRSEEHTSELQSPCNLVCRLLLEKKNKTTAKDRAQQQTHIVVVFGPHTRASRRTCGPARKQVFHTGIFHPSVFFFFFLMTRPPPNSPLFPPPPPSR